MSVNFEGILAALSSKTSDKTPGKDLKYDPIYDKIKESRFEEETYLSRGIWERDLKRADWAEVERLCATALTEDTSDLQIVCWLCEAWCHSYSWAGLEASFSFFERFLTTYWDLSYPLIGEENFDVGVEHRVRIIEWFLEKIHDCILFIPLNNQGGTEVEINFATLASAVKLDSVVRRSGLGETRIQELESSGEITLRKFRKILKQIPVAHIQSIVSTVSSVVENVSQCEEFLAEKCESQGPSFAKLKELLASITKTCEPIIAEQPKDTIAIVAQDVSSIPPEEESQYSADFSSLPDEHSAAPPAANASSAATESNSEEISITGKADAYRALSDLADYLIEIDPQNPGPYLVKLVSNWYDRPFPALLDDIAAGETQGHKVLKMMAEIVKRG
ncbi:MAG: type VI secretion system protein TssA [Holosporales bacterium]|jgi:type VI secretion system protein ImpA|nr:type VI secretion system protein TssA [Holosporales bacterium]